MASNGWKRTTLGQEVDLLTGFPFRSALFSNEITDIPLVRGDNVIQGKFRWDGVKRWSASDAANYQSYLLQPGDVVLAMDRPWIEAGLKYAWVTEFDIPCLLVQRVARLRSTGGLDQGFLRYVIGSRSFTDYVLGIQTGTAVPHISRSQIEAYSFECPSLPEQRAIAHILGTLDDKIELNRRMNESLEAIARALYQSWFVDFDPVRAKAAGQQPAGMDAETSALFPDDFEESALGEIPRGWKVAQISDFFDINPSRSLKRGQIAPYLDMANMPTASARATRIASREFGSGMRFVNGDTLIARITPCLENGKTAFVDFLAPGQVGWGSTEYIVARPKPPIPGEFGYFLARTDRFRVFATANMTGTSGRQRVSASAFDHFTAVVPDNDVASAFGSFARATLRKMKSNDEQSAILVAIREVLLPRLLSGEMRISKSIPINGLTSAATAADGR